MKQIILDTNILRKWFTQSDPEFDDNKTLQIKRMIKEKGIIILFSKPVAYELLCNFKKPTEEAQNSSYYSLKYLSEISIIKTENETDTRAFSPSFLGLYCNYFYEKLFDSINKYEINIPYLVYSFLEDNDKEGYSELIKILQEDKEAELNQLVNNVKNFLKGHNNGVLDWNIFKTNKEKRRKLKFDYESKYLHLNLLYSQLLSVNLHSNNEELNLMRNLSDGISDFSVSLDFYISFIYNKLMDGSNLDFNEIPNMKKKWNSFYDYQLILACEFENALGKETTFITNDKPILYKFKKFNKEKFVMNQEQLEKFLFD